MRIVCSLVTNNPADYIPRNEVPLGQWLMVNKQTKPPIVVIDIRGSQEKLGIDGGPIDLLIDAHSCALAEWDRIDMEEKQLIVRKVGYDE